MPEGKAASGAGRRPMHTRSVECNGYIRDDGLWEVEARLVDVKPFTQAPDGYRGELKPGDPVHDIRLRLAVDDAMKVHEAEATMQATPYPTSRSCGDWSAKALARAGARWSAARSAGSKVARICRNCWVRR